MLRRASRLSVVLAVGGLIAAAPPSRAQTAAPQDEPSAKRLDRFEKELREVRQIVLQAHATGQPVEIKEAGPDPQLVALQGRIDDGAEQVRHLTGEIETLTHDLEAARKDLDDSRAQTASLADRLDKLEKQVAALGPAAALPPSPGPAPDAGNAAAPPPAADPKVAYAHARQLLEDGDYPGATTELQAYIDHYGDTPTGAVARYWLGEAKFIQKDYAGAATAYLGAIRGWPKTNWAPEAVVKLSQALLELGKPQDACGALGELDRRYPHVAPTLKARAAATRARAQCPG
ncbi:MAG TPA: tol-pal system protein YbgF [Caulobacteraceae bacterium]|jgi:tol-pal system protein YbgF|nr:tol-pal system protein YbgF [Caulobacteraceae bacterium]